MSMTLQIQQRTSMTKRCFSAWVAAALFFDLFAAQLHAGRVLWPDPVEPTRQSTDWIVPLLGFELLAGFVLVMVFLIGSLLMVRTMRRVRGIFFRPQPTPTPSEDVWMMHTLPSDAFDTDPFEEYA